MDKIGNPVSLNSRAEKSKNARIEKAAEKAAFAIFSSFRKSDTDDPDVYLAAVMRVLMAYPEEVMRAVADPLTGVAGEQTFLPSIAELRAALDRRYQPILTKQRIEEKIARTRRIIDEAPDRPTAGQRTRAVDRWEHTKAELRGGVARSHEETRRDAEERLRELYHARAEPLAIGRQLRSKLTEMMPEKKEPLAGHEGDRADGERL
jgi:hypothetical protein